MIVLSTLAVCPQGETDALAIIESVAETLSVLEEFAHQCGVITYSQALQSGLTQDQIQSYLRRGKWQRIHRGTFATFSGPVPRASLIWAALLASGPGATLSHESAAEIAGFAAKASRQIHVTVPADRRVKTRIHGVVVHRSRRVDSARHPSRIPPPTRVEETALDLADTAKTADEAVGWLTKACSSRRTTAAHLARALTSRKRIKWRDELVSALADIESGATSPLEMRYLRDVERAHGLPTAKRQARHERLGGSIYDDVHYVDYGVVAELDGRVAHADSTFRDLDRDNVAARRGDVVLHYGWDDISNDPCRVAAEVCDVLASRGWSDRSKRCIRENCMIVGRS